VIGPDGLPLANIGTDHGLGLGQARNQTQRQWPNGRPQRDTQGGISYGGDVRQPTTPFTRDPTGKYDLSGLPQGNWLQAQFGVQQPDWNNVQDVQRFQRQLQYYWPDIIQRDPTLGQYVNGKLQPPAFLNTGDSAII